MPATDADWQGLPSRVLGRTDRGSEFFGYDSTYLEKDKPKTLVEFEKVAAEEGVQRVEASPRDGNKGNGICERHHRTIFDIASGFLRQSHVSPLFWVEAYRYATLLYNSMTTSHTGQYSPHELVYGKRPWFDRIRVFGCDMYEHLADLPKVPGGVKARKGYFFGLPEDSPTGYLMYDINAAVVRTVYSATFDESFRRRLAGIKVYDTAREIYGLRKRSGKHGAVYDDGDGEDGDRDELLEGVRLFLKKPHGSEDGTTIYPA